MGKDRTTGPSRADGTYKMCMQFIKKEKENNITSIKLSKIITKGRRPEGEKKKIRSKRKVRKDTVYIGQ